MEEAIWQAIISNDSSFDGKFYYGVRTTGIFCRPSCKSRNPKQEHVMIFKNAGEAAAQRFRPCKRCKPTQFESPEEEWVRHIAQTIDTYYQEPLTLLSLANKLHASPYHMSRIFKRIMGVTPIVYLQNKRISSAQRLLIQTEMPVTAVAHQVGFPNPSHFSTVFLSRTGLTPTEYRHSGSNIEKSGVLTCK